MLFKVHVRRMMGSSLLEEIVMNNKYIFKELAQGKIGALARNAVDCCLPTCFGPSCPWKSNSSRAAAQKSSGPLGALQSVSQGSHLSHSSSSTAMLGISSLHTNQAFPSSMAWVLSCGIWVLISASLSAEMEGKGVGFVILGRETSPASTDQNFVVLHPSPLGREPQPPASSRTVKLLQGKSS